MHELSKCRIVIVERERLPPGHEFVIVGCPQGTTVFTLPGDAELRARIATLEWLQGRVPASLAADLS